jgi:opacity protein-like surface antigen
MKLQIIKKIVPSLLLVATTALASDSLLNKVYVRADGGVGFPQSAKSRGLSYQFKNTPLYGAGLGFKINEMFRTDINFQHMDLKSSKSDSIFKQSANNSVFLNGYFNLTDFEQMTPYVTAGVGYAMNNTKSNRKEQGSIVTTADGEKTKTFVWNVGCGMQFHVYKKIKFDFAYRFVNVGDIKMKNVVEDDDPLSPIHLKNNKVHQLTMGIAFNL